MEKKMETTTLNYIGFGDSAKSLSEEKKGDWS